MSPESRVQARISWLLDNGTQTAVNAIATGSSGGGGGGGDCPAPRSLVFVSTAAAALLRPRASACLAADPDLVALAGATLAKFGRGGGRSGAGGGDGGGGGEEGKVVAREVAVFLPLAEDLLRAAGGPARERLLRARRGRKRPRDNSASASPAPSGGGGGWVTSPEEESQPAPA